MPLRKTPARRLRGQSYDARILADSPAAFWRLTDEDGKVAADASGQGNTGLYLGEPGLGAPGLIARSGASVRFDGIDDEINFRDSASLTSAKSISLEAWVSPDLVPTAPRSAWQLVSKWSTALLFLRGGASPEFVFALYDSAGASPGVSVACITTVAPDSVYHVVGTYDGSKLRIYVNGSLEGAVGHRGSLEDGAFGGAIAAAGWGDIPSPRFQGRLGGIAIYKTALASAKVRGHFKAGTSG